MVFKNTFIMKKSTITKFLDALSSNLSCCLFSKNTIPKLNFSKFKAGVLLPFIFMALMLMNNTVSGQANVKGNVPVVWPTGGFGVDGDAFANQPTPGVGDWWPAPGAGGSVFTAGGVVIPPPAGTTVVNFLDKYKGDPEDDITVFAQSDKINDNPNTYNVKAGTVPPKDDMQHAIAVFTWGNPTLTTPTYAATGNATDLWVLFAADRWQVNGSSYIDFEFNQNAITLNPDGTFTTEAPLTDAAGDPTGGRTPGDILVTIEFTGGGSTGSVWVDTWAKAGPGSAYLWTTVDLNSTQYKNTIFITHNDTTELSPWPIFDQKPDSSGNYYYAIDQYVEGAINLTQIMGTDAKCGHFATVWTRTKSSHSSTAQLKDLGGITSLNVGATPPVAICSTVNVPACTSKDNMDIAFASWKASFANTSGTGTEPVVPTFDPLLPTSLPENAGCGYTFTTTYTLTDDCGKTDSCTGTFTIAAPPPPVIADKPDVVLEGCNPEWPAVVTTTYTDCDAGGTIEGVAGEVQTSQDGCTQFRDYTFNFTDSCLNAALPQVTRVSRHYDVTAPVLTCSVDQTIDCGSIPVFVTPTATDNCTSSNDIVIVSGDVVIVNNADGSVTHTKTWTATDDCGNVSVSCSQNIIVLACNEGCTLGYWKNHTDRWCSSYTPSMLFGTVFVNAPSNLANLTLLQALNLGGGGIYNLARQGVAALLNACSDEVDYPAPYLDNPQSVIDAVNAAYLAGGSAPGKLATQLDNLNNSGCPLGGTSATTATNKEDGLRTEADFTAYPVPFKDVLTIRCNFDYTTDVKIEVFDSQGILVLSKTDPDAYLNKEIMLHLHSYKGQEQVYIVKVTTNRGSSVKKVISSK